MGIALDERRSIATAEIADIILKMKEYELESRAFITADH
jgi:ACT domain-containing protein